MARKAYISDEQAGQELLRKHAILAAGGEDPAKVGDELVEAYLGMGRGEEADLGATVNDILTNVAKHAHDDGVSLDEIVGAMGKGSDGDRDAVANRAAALFASMRPTVAAQGRDFDTVLFVVGEHLAAELPRPHNP